MTRRKPENPTDPPRHLGESGLKLWSRIRADFALTDAAGLHLLALAAEAADRAAAARSAITADGLTTKDRWGQVKAHPAAVILRDAVAQQIMALRALGVTGSPED